jgi:hypothetical protein
MDVAQFTPFGFGVDMYDAGREAGMGNFGAAGLTLGMAGMPGPGPKGIRAYHGSPHDFDAFSMSKIGTGEGAQAYGHGLYFAENEAIARSYRDALAAGVKPEFRPTNKYSTVGWKAEAEKLFPNDRERQAAFHLFNQMKNKDYVLENHDFITSLPHNQGKPYEWEGVEFTRDRLAQLADEFYDPGKMYEVNINADPDTFLDWDKPLSEQPGVLQKLGYSTRTRGEINAEADALVARYGSVPDMPSEAKARWTELEAEFDKIAPNVSGADFYRGTDPDNYLHSALSGNGVDPAYSRELLEKGIPGIKYLDAGSRVPSAMAKKELAEWQAQLPIAERELADATARGDTFLIGRKQAEVQRVKDGIARVSQEAEGTRNYVVFDDKLISIVRKYGIAGASAMLGYNILDGMDPAQAAELKQIEGNQ